MKYKKINFFLFFIIFSTLLSSEITYLSSKTFQDEDAVKVVISINSTEEIDKNDISIFEYQTSLSMKDSLFNLIIFHKLFEFLYLKLNVFLNLVHLFGVQVDLFFCHKH